MSVVDGENIRTVCHREVSCIIRDGLSSCDGLNHSNIIYVFNALCLQ